MRTRWIGDLRTSFLHDDGWTFRVEVNRFQLAGREGWRLPLTFADHIALGDHETRTLAPSRPELGDDVWIARRSGACVGGPIDGPLRRLGAASGDLMFFSATADRYAITVRHQRELADATALQRLLWSCGLDPKDPNLLDDPWAALAKALCGSGRSGRDGVRERLEQRGDTSLLGLLEDAGRSRAEWRQEAEVPWPEAWQYRLPLVEAETLPGLRAVDRTVRVALGVLDASNQVPRELMLGDGDLLWLHQGVAADPEDIHDLLRTPPLGLVPAAHRSGWTAVIRAEHAARRLALAGEDWSVAVLDDAWHLDGRAHPTLLDALRVLEDPELPIVPAPSRAVQEPYPRGAVAVRSAADQAVQAGLRAVVADRSHGFRAEFVEHDMTGAALHEVLRPA